MVSLTQVRSSNSRIASSLPPGLIAVFVGATNGIGESTLKQFAKYTRQPRVYFIGRSQEAGDRISLELKSINPDGTFIFIKSDVSLIQNVDEVCQELKSKEKVINLLFLSQGVLDLQTRTSEGLRLTVSLLLHSRHRFIVNLLPLLQQASHLRRIVSVATGTKEGPIDPNDIQTEHLSGILRSRGQAASQITLSLESIAKKAPTISYIHEFPGPVKTGIGREMKGLFMIFMKILMTILGPFVNIPIEESGERHLYISTSARYPENGGNSGVPLESNETVAKGSNGKEGSGVYSVDWDGESAGDKVVTLLEGYRKDGMMERVWKFQEEDYLRITGKTEV